MTLKGNIQRAAESLEEVGYNCTIDSVKPAGGGTMTCQHGQKVITIDGKKSR